MMIIVILAFVPLLFLVWRIFMSINYASHGTARVAVVACPHLVGNRMVLLSTKGEYSWAIRDYIAGAMLRSGNSRLTLSEIEADIAYSEKPAYRSVNRNAEWARELEQSSKGYFAKRYDPTSAPLQSTGTWKSFQ